MKKFFLIPLLTLCTCVMAWAVDVADKEDLAVAIATENAAITLTADITLDPGTLDLNGATISCGANKLVFATENGTYTLQNGTFAGGTNMSTGVLYISGNAVTLNLESIVINNTNATGIGVGSSAIVNIDASSVSSCTTQDINLTGANSTATINNYGRIEGTGICQGTDKTPCLESTFNNYAGAYWKQRKAYRQNLTVSNAGSIDFYNGTQIRTGTVHVTNSGTFSVNGSTAKILANGTLHITNNGTATISNGQHGPGNLILDGSNNTTISGGTIYNTLNITINEGGEATISGGGFQGPTIVNNGTATISGGTFNTNPTTFNGTNNTLITAGTFEVAPIGTMGYIEPTSTNCIFTEGVGDLTIADGYVWRESDGLIVVAPPTTVAATLKHLGGSQNYAYVESAFTDAVSGDSIILMDDYTTSSSIWIGTANVGDTPRSLTFDLNGHTLSTSSSISQTFSLTHGSLYVINSVPGQGGIENVKSSGKVFVVYGTYQKGINSRTATISSLFSYLSIAEGVKLNASGEGGSAIVVNYLQNKNIGNQYITKYTSSITNKAVTEGLSNGVRVDVKGEIIATKYGISVSGNIKYPDPLKYTRPSEEDLPVLKSDTAFSPFIHVYPSATISVPGDVTSAVAAYSSGYGRWLIEGKCMGATGLYVKSGSVKIKDALIESTWTQTATLTSGKESGVEDGGSAVVVESNRSYSGEQTVIVSGDSKMTSRAAGGSAFLELVDPNTEGTKVDSIVIYGGTFTAKNAIIVSDVTLDDPNAVVIIYGSTLNSDDEDIETYVTPLLASGVHTTEIINSDQSRTVIVSAGSTPIEITNFGTSADPQEDEIVDIAEQQDRPDANWTGTTPGEVSNGTTVALGELQIISGTSENGGQQLTVGENATLQVERLIMNEYATIVVEAGGQLIVDGKQGINAPEESNIILETSETDQATFLFNPDVTSNRHPMATVKLTTKAKQTATNDYIYERFTIPTMDGNATTYGAENLGSVVTYDGGEFKQALYKWNGSDWEFMPSFKAMNPFQGYQLTNNSLNGEVVYTFEGNLVGNTDNDYTFVESGFGFFGNSYSADINIGKLFESFEGSDMQKTIWIYDYITDGFKTITPESYGSVKYGTRKNPQGVITDIRSMQAFLMNKATAGTTTVDYGSAIWGNPKYGLVGGGSGAPAKRVAADDRDYITIYVANETSEDEVTFIRSNEYSNAFDNGADASKWMNNGINLYVTTEEGDLAAVASDEIINMTIAFRSGNETEYTLGFDNLNGEEYAIRDILTGIVTNMSEGATYTFTQEANTTIPARFQIVGAYKMPTGMESIEEGNAVQQKVIMNGTLYILRDNKWYNVQGQIVK